MSSPYYIHFDPWTNDIWQSTLFHFAFMQSLHLHPLSIAAEIAWRLWFKHVSMRNLWRSNAIQVEYMIAQFAHHKSYLYLYQILVSHSSPGGILFLIESSIFLQFTFESSTLQPKVGILVLKSQRTFTFLFNSTLHFSAWLGNLYLFSLFSFHFHFIQIHLFFR